MARWLTTVPIFVACICLVLFLAKSSNLGTGHVPATRRGTIGAGGAILLGGAGGVAPRTFAKERAFKVPKMGIGAWAWGDPLFWGYDKSQDPALNEVFNYCVSNGVNFFDTAEIYGLGRSETLIGQFSKSFQERPLIATKFAPFPWRGSRKDVVKACKESINRLGVDQIDLYQIHFPGAFKNKNYWDGLGDCYEQGLVKSVGVSNYGVDALKGIKKTLDERGIPLASNQIQYSLLYRYPEENGLRATCEDMGVDILAYSPLCLGFLVGKYTPENLPKGPRAVLGKKLLSDPDYLELLSTMQRVADIHGATKPQVALAWCIAKGTCPIPGARNLRQAKENVAAVGLTLTPEDILLLDTASEKVKPVIAPEANPFPKYDKELGIRMYDS